MNNYRLRHIQDKVLFLAQNFKVILVTGARQTGKSTLLRKLLPNIPMVTFDPIIDSYGAFADPELFLKTQPRPLILDEIQYVPELLSTIKRFVDESDQMGQYFLTGSHSLGTLKVTAESMAGRVGIIDLDHLTLFEEKRSFSFVGQGHAPPTWLESYLREPSNIHQHFAGVADAASPVQALWRGGFPALLTKDDSEITAYLSRYLRTYVERDAVYADKSTADPIFGDFLKTLAASTGKEINYQKMGNELGVSRTIINQWLYVVHQTYQWREIPPYFSNALKRVTKRHKGYMTDTGLACYLMGVRDATGLLGDRSLGSLFETYCVNMICALLGAMRRAPEIYHWRTLAGAEVDIVLWMNGKLYPIEVKVASRVSKNDVSGIAALRKTYPDMVEHGIVLYTGGLCYGITDYATALPFNALMKG